MILHNWYIIKMWTVLVRVLITKVPCCKILQDVLIFLLNITSFPPRYNILILCYIFYILCKYYTL